MYIASALWATLIDASTPSSRSRTFQIILQRLKHRWALTAPRVEGGYQDARLVLQFNLAWFLCSFARGCSCRWDVCMRFSMVYCWRQNDWGECSLRVMSWSLHLSTQLRVWGRSFASSPWSYRRRVRSWDYRCSGWRRREIQGDSTLRTGRRWVSSAPCCVGS